MKIILIKLPGNEVAYDTAGALVKKDCFCGYIKRVKRNGLGHCTGLNWSVVHYYSNIKTISE